MRLVLFAVLCLQAWASARTDFSLWKDSARVYFNTSVTGAATQSAVANFPLLIRLHASNFNMADAAKGGADLRFTDPDGTEIPCHIARWDTGFYHNAEVWVNVPKVDANSTSDYVVMWWGNKAVPALTKQVAIRQGPGEVFLGGDVPQLGRVVFDTAFGFSGAWHLDEEGPLKAASPIYRDMSQAGNSGEDSVAGLSGAGIVGRAQQFDPLTGDYIAIKHTPTQVFNGPLTFSAWIKGNKWAGTGVGANLSQVNAIVRKGDVNNNPYQFCVAQGRLMLSLDSSDNGGLMTNSTLALGQWIHVAGVWDGKNVQLYVDGKLDMDKPPTRMPALGKADTRPLYLGGRPVNFTDVNTLDLFDGAMDEIHMARAARTKDWIKLAYENQKQGSSILSLTRVQVPPKDTLPREDYSKWRYKKRILFNTTATGANVAKAVTAFPLLIRIDSTVFDFSQALPDGRDLRFADADGTALPISIVHWNPWGSTEMWTRIPKVDGNSRTDFITLYWGKADAPDVHRSSLVFDTADGWAGVWHLQSAAAGKGTAKAYREETGFQNLGDDYVTANPQAGLIGLGQRFGTGMADYVRVPSAPGLQPAAAITFSAWIKADTFDSHNTGNLNSILRKGESSPNNYYLGFRNGILAAGIDDGEDGAKYNGTALQAKTWYHVGAAWGQDAVMRFYVNGAEAGSASYPKMSGIGKDTRPLYIGGRAGANPSDSGDQFKGMLDEVQLSSVERPAEFMKLAYESQRRDGKLLLWEGATVPADTVPKPTATSDTVLKAGETFVYGSIYLVSNPLDGDSPVHIRFLPAADRRDRGIADARETIKLEPAQTGKPFPKVLLEANTNLAGGVGLFRVEPDGNGGSVIQAFGKGIGSWTLSQAGEYFLGRDTVAPSIRFLDEGIDDEDSTWITFQPMDNVSNLSLTLSHSRGTGTEASAAPTAHPAGGMLRLAFPPGGDLAPELLHVRVDDGALAGGFPDLDGAWYQMLRRVRAAKAPIPIAGNLAWTFAGIPLRLDRPVTLREASSGATLYGAVWVNDSTIPKRGAWRLLEAEDTLPTGGGIWLAAPKAVPALALGDGLSAAMAGGGHYHANLVKGWNQVTSPGLVDMPWPIRFADTEAKDASAVKSLLALDPATGGYVDADTLKAWQGYFVYAKQDMVVELVPGGSVHAPKRAAARTASRRPVLQAILEPAPGAWSQGAVSRLRLGAAEYAADGVGIEDEPAPPAAGAGGSLSLSRGAGGLRTDLVGWRGPAEYQWKLAWTPGDGRRPDVARVRVAELAVPEGMTLWAASPLRAIAEPVAAGSELEVLGDDADTLLFWAAPAGLPFPEGKAFSLRPIARSAIWLRDGAGGRLRIALPEVAGLRAECLDFSGRRLEMVERAALAPGYYEFALGPLGSSGLRIVTVAFRGGRGPSRITLKISGR